MRTRFAMTRLPSPLVPAMRAPGGCPFRRAFTVLELTLVLAIGSVLALLLAFAIGRQRTSAQQASCMQNMRQLFIGLATYAGEHAGQLPPIFNAANSWTWASTLGASGAYLPFRENFQHYSCPFAPVMEGPNLSRQVDTYGMIKEKDGVPDIPFVTKGPQTPLLCDSTFLVAATPRYQKQYYAVNKQTWTSGVALWHQKRANMVFADGHGETLTRKDLEDPQRFPPTGFKYFYEP